MSEILLIVSYSFIYGLRVSYDIAFATKCVDEKYIFLKLLINSLDQCVVECARRKACLAISFCRRFTLCNLLNTDEISEMALSSTHKDDCNFVRKSDMRYNDDCLKVSASSEYDNFLIQLPAGCQECKVGQNCDFENAKCTITECPKLSLDNGLLLGNMNGVGNRLRFTCNSGYRAETSESYTTCEETGNWSIIPKCVKIRVKTKTLGVDNGGKWGNWGTPELCPVGTFASGYTMKIEAQQLDRDDTSLNAIRLICSDLEGMASGHITSLEGPFGDWTQEEHCTKGTYLVDFQLHIDIWGMGKKADSDNTGANYVKFHCRDIAGHNNKAELVLPPGAGFRGIWGSWSDTCGPNSAICGLGTKVEGHQGDGFGDEGTKDDTALNDVVFYCCDDTF